MTTDPFPKEAAVEVVTPAGRFRVGGIAKGSGMIEPLMATMLAFVTTDARVEPALLQRALAAVVDVTFNAISVDGECSTNDCVFALANGASGVSLGESDSDLLVESLRRVCEPLAIGIVRGGEGATKLVTVAGDRRGGARPRPGRPRGRSRIRRSSRRPCTAAIRTGDAWWRSRPGAGVDFDLGARARPDRRRGALRRRTAVRRTRTGGSAASAAARGRAHVDLGTGGSGTARMWTCDLSAEYVQINAEYRT